MTNCKDAAEYYARKEKENKIKEGYKSYRVVLVCEFESEVEAKNARDAYYKLNSEIVNSLSRENVDAKEVRFSPLIVEEL